MGQSVMKCHSQFVCSLELVQLPLPLLGLVLLALPLNELLPLLLALLDGRLGQVLRLVKVDLE